MNMDASERAGEQPPRPAARLQPEDCAESSAAGHRALIEDDLNDAELDEARTATERLDQLEAERDHVELLRKSGFAGPAYEIFAAALAAYGIPVIRAWIRTHRIYKLSRDYYGRGVACEDDVREHLATHADDRLELALDIVAHGLVFFRCHALDNGKWAPEGGASLKTFFIGACLAVFPNVFRSWLKEHDAGARQHAVTVEPTIDTAKLDRLILTHDDDPADVVADRLWFAHELSSMPERVRHAIAAVVLRDEDYTTIAERLGMTSDALKQMLYRYRSEARRRQRKGRQP
jgi:DNA-directed RNA polymerase specialized sigma24 family protein